MNNGWISIHRQLLDHWLWKENREFSKAEAWIDILMNVNHTPQEVVIKTTVYKVGRGESIMSLDTWGKRWKWNKSKVRRFLSLLQEQSMIELKNETQTTRLTVCKYDSYQVQRNTNETQMKRKRNASETQMTPNNNGNKENKENNENNYREFAHLSLSQIEYDKLNEFWSKKQIDEILDSIENYAKNKSYTSLYLTCRKWLTKEYPKGKVSNIVTPNVN